MTGGRFWVVAIVVALATACGGADSGSDRAVPLTTDPDAATTAASPETTTSSAAPTTTVLAFGFDQALVSKVWADYEAAMNAIKTALMQPDNDTNLEEHLSGAMLEHWEQKLIGMTERGEYMYFPTDSTSHERLYGVSMVSESTIDLTVCVWDDSVLAVRESGAIVNDDRALNRPTERMELVDGTWKLASREGRPAKEAECTGL